ncbi:MAG: hypothetical protein P8Y42_08885 [Exilibacterium sp.]
MPDPLELPGVFCAVIPLVGGQRFAGFRRGIVLEFIAFPDGRAIRAGCRLAVRRSRLLPGLTAVTGALDDLAEPGGGLGGLRWSHPPAPPG